ncbi:MAG: hypothetical protein VX438_08040 [Planctomycetota bacterium]|jgi:hypothetical protein|nr:hypothetical protein [Planctomycetota bacterium]
MIHCFCFLLALLPVFDKNSPAKASPEKARSHTQMDRDISAFLRNEAIAKTDFSRAAAIRDLCTIAIEVRYHERFKTSLMMQTLKNRIRTRLGKIAQKTARKYKTQKLADNQILFAEGTDEPDMDLILSQNIQLAGFSSGGPISFFARTHGLNGGGIIERNADDLIRLIQSTINPSFWNVEGGVGSIIFYAPLNALVIRATEDIHYKIGGSLNQLEFFNR